MELDGTYTLSYFPHFRKKGHEKTPGYPDSPPSSLRFLPRVFATHDGYSAIGGIDISVATIDHARWISALVSSCGKATPKRGQGLAAPIFDSGGG